MHLAKNIAKNIAKNNFAMINNPVQIIKGYGLLKNHVQIAEVDKEISLAIVYPGFYVPASVINNCNVILDARTPMEYREINADMVNNETIIKSQETLIGFAVCQSFSTILEHRCLRLFDFLVSFAKSINVSKIPFHMTHETIGSLTGSTRVSVTRLLGKFEEEGLLTIRKRRIIYKGLEI
jgi:CRP-like cAMP-binding protein